MEKITWKCSSCGYTFEKEAGQAPPEACPGCKEKCEFLNVSCYVPECGATGQDPRLGGK
jgi:rubredoxin